MRLKYKFFEEIQDILKNAELNQGKRSEQVERAKAQGYQLTPQKREEHFKARLEDLRTARERFSKLQKDFNQYVIEEARPFSIIEFENPSGKKEKRLASLRSDEREFLETLKFIPLAPEDYVFLAEYARNNDRSLLCHALIAQAEQNGYALTGVLPDPKKEIKEFETCLKMADILLDPDGYEKSHVAECRVLLENAIKNAFPYDDTGKTKHETITIEKKDYDLGENPGTLTNEKPADDLTERMAFYNGFEPGSGDDMAMAVARARTEHVQFTKKQAEQSAKDAQKAPEEVREDVSAD